MLLRPRFIGGRELYPPRNGGRDPYAGREAPARKAGRGERDGDGEENLRGPRLEYLLLLFGGFIEVNTIYYLEE